ncbi:MAG: helix-turn-helix domain-containing protein [Planctomycetota bacterium]|nr:hypothetical protein [Planctomycetota bacterium]
MSSAATSSCRQRSLPPAAALARTALAALLAGDVHAGSPTLVVVVSADAGRLLADLGGEVHEAGDLAGRLAAAEARGTQDRLRAHLIRSGRVLVRGADEIGPSRLQRSFAALLDAAAAEGTSVCVSLARPPAATHLHPALESRLSAGLVVSTAGGQAAPASTRHTSISAVIQATARAQGIADDRIVGEDRHRTAVRSRGLAMFIARTCTGMSLGAIGRHFGGREHTTVMRCIRGIESRLASDSGLAAELREILAALDSRPNRIGRRRSTRVDSLSEVRSRKPH